MNWPQDLSSYRCSLALQLISNSPFEYSSLNLEYQKKLLNRLWMNAFFWTFFFNLTDSNEDLSEKIMLVMQSSLCSNSSQIFDLLTKSTKLKRKKSNGVHRSKFIETNLKSLPSILLLLLLVDYEWQSKGKEKWFSSETTWATTASSWVRTIRSVESFLFCLFFLLDVDKSAYWCYSY